MPAKKAKIMAIAIGITGKGVEWKVVFSLGIPSVGMLYMMWLNTPATKQEILPNTNSLVGVRRICLRIKKRLYPR